MPRRTTAETLERQVIEDSDLEDLPDFGDAPTRTREAQIAELDARDDRLNGANGVRPSQQCGVLAGSGPAAGRRCTYAEHPMNQPHSWEVSSEPTDNVGHVYDDDEQATLPGTPEPETDEYSIPFESQFNGADFMAAPGIEEIAERFINDESDFEHLIGLRIRYFWKRRGGLKGGNKRLGALVKPGGLSAYALGRPQFALWLAADHVRDAKLTREQFDALVYDMLCRAQRDPDDHDQYRVIGSDFEGMIATVKRFGLWQMDLRELGANVKQLGLLDVLELPAGDGDQDDEGDDE
jgi:hypothetical protein